MATSPIFTAGGLASGLDTNTIVDKLVALESQPITKNTARQAALTVQISAIGDLMSKIKALSSSASTLKTGVAANVISAVPSGVTGGRGNRALPGTTRLLSPRRRPPPRPARTQFASASTTVAGGALHMHIQGVDTTINITAGSDLGSVVQQINAAGSPSKPPSSATAPTSTFL